MQNLKPFLKTVTKTDTATTVAATVMLTVGTLAMFLTWGMLAMAAVFAAAPRAVVRMAAVGDYDPCAGRDDCALRIDSAAQFDRLVASWDLEHRRGPAVSAEVPRVPEVDVFCAGHAKCLKTPLFYNRQGNFSSPDFIKENFPDAFVGLSKEEIDRVFSDPWDGSARTAIYDFVDLHRIRQDPSRYGAALYTEHDRATWGEPKLPTLERVTSLVSGLQRGVGLGPVHYYPDGKYQELLAQARAWEAAGVPFPIFYETLWANEIASEEQYRTLIGCRESDPFCRLMLVVPRASKIDAYCAPFREQGKKCLDRIVYANSTFAAWHLDVLNLLAPEQVAGFQGVAAVLPAELFGPDGVYRMASLWRTWPDLTFRFSLFSLFVNLAPGGNTPFTPTLENIQEIFTPLKQSFTVPGAKFGYVPLTDDEIAEAKTWPPQEFRVILPTEGPPYESYTQGTAYGRLRVLPTLAAFDELRRTGGISWQDILVFAEAPFDVETPVAATITGTRQVTNASHLSLRMARRNLPNVYVENAVTVFASYDGKLVKLVVDATSATAEETTPQAVATWQAEHRPKLKPPQPVNRTYRGLDRIREVTEEPTSAFSRFGGKANGLVKLYRILVPRYQLEAFAIPFSYYFGYIRGNRLLDVSKFPAECRYQGVTYEEFIVRVLADDRFRSDPAIRYQCLDRFWKYTKDKGTVDPALVRALAARIQELWHDGNSDGRDDVTGKLIRVRFRSSSDMEDGLEFNGAGLYESRTVCLADQFDADTVATCDPSEDHEETIEHALRDVWMSAWLPRAFEEREYYQLPQDKVAMAILANTGTPDERDNGVAFTGDPQFAREAGSPYRNYDIFVQTGETSVVSPAPGVLPEVNRAVVDTRRSVISPRDFSVYRYSRSTEVPPDQYVLSQDEVQEMGFVMHNIDQKFSLDRRPYAPERVLLDMEFKHLPSGQLIFKQVRPYLIGEAVRFTDPPVLPVAPSGLTAEVTPTKVTLRWQAAAASDDTLTIVERSFSGTVWQAAATLRSSVTTYTDTTVRPGRIYHYRVRLENQFGQSGPSPAVIVTVPQPPQCADAGDNDGDGKIDLADPGCQNAEDDNETDPPAPTFRRGDADGSSLVDISDAIFTLNALFVDTNIKILCEDAADSTDDGRVDISDAINTLNYLFIGTGDILPPGPTTPGPDPTADGLDCARYPAP